MKKQHREDRTIRQRIASPRFPNQAEHNLFLQKIMDTALMCACCVGTVSVMSFLMAAL